MRVEDVFPPTLSVLEKYLSDLDVTNITHCLLQDWCKGARLGDGTLGSIGHREDDKVRGDAQFVASLGLIVDTNLGGSIAKRRNIGQVRHTGAVGDVLVKRVLLPLSRDEGFWDLVHPVLQLLHSGFSPRRVAREEGVLPRFDEAVLKDDVGTAEIVQIDGVGAPVSTCSR